MKKLSLAVLALLALVSCNQQPVTSNNDIQYMPFMETEKSGWGLIGTDGQVLVRDEFKQMTTVVMHDRFFAQNKNGKWELFGTENHSKQIGDEYTQVGAFIAEVAPVVEEGRSIEFIDVNGKVVFMLDNVDGKEVSTCTNFSDGVAVFRAGKYCGVINTKGDVVVNPRYIEILPANEGKMLALDRKYEMYLQEGEFDKIKFTVLSTTGEELSVISTRNYKIASSSFVEGALVVTDESGSGNARTGLINVQGDWIIKPSEQIKSIKAIHNGTFIYSNGDAYGVMNFNGDQVIQPRYANLIYANKSGLLYAKIDKERPEYKLIDMEEKQIGREQFSNVLPFINGKAIVQQSANNWNIIDEKGEDQQLRQDIYSISASAYGEPILVSEHVDYEKIITALKLTKDGFLDMTLNMDAEHIANAVSSIAVAGELGGQAVTANPAKFEGVSTVDGKFVVSGIGISLSSSFDEPMAANGAFKNITPNQIGLEIPAVGMLRGKSGTMARDLINRVQAFGQTLKSNQNAAIVRVGETSYFVANSGTGVYVVYGYLDVNRIDIAPYENIVDKAAAPLKRYEVENVFDIIESNVDDIYEIGGAFDAGEYEEMLQQFVENAAKISAVIKSANSNPEDLQRIAELVKDAQAIGEQLEKAKGDMSPAQLSRYMEAYKLLLDAVSDKK